MAARVRVGGVAEAEIVDELDALRRAVAKERAALAALRPSLADERAQVAAAEARLERLDGVANPKTRAAVLTIAHQFEAFVEELVPSNNLFYAIRVEAEFDRMTVREATRQQHPFPGLADAVKSQHENTVGATSGTMLGFKGPDVFQGLSVADFHLHYLDTARGFGGHVMDFGLVRGTLTMEAYAGFSLRLPQDASYLNAELDDMSADEAIRQAESS